jgi:hypothetical protein
VRRPLPPELITLGDQLEAAAARALQRRRTRRQQVLNALASLVVVVPIAASLVITQVSSDGGLPGPAPTPTAQPIARVVNHSGLRPARDDFPPRDLRRMREAPNSALLLAKPSLRPALR